jgi:hypothetical protein
MIFRSKKRETDATSANGDGAVATAESAPEELQAEIRRLMDENRSRPDRERERRILRLRHLLGIRHLEGAEGDAAYPEPDYDALPDERLPRIDPDRLTPGLLRAGILRDGALWVRGAVSPEASRALADGIERAFTDRAAFNEGSPVPDSIYEEFVPEPGFKPLTERKWIEAGGGVFAADSPRLIFEMLDAFGKVGLTDVISGYLGEPASVSAEKCTLRVAGPKVGGAWHQDGNFMGDVRAMNVWLALSHCGDDAPGLDLVPKRVDHLLESGTDDAPLDWIISNAKVEEEAGDAGIIRPIFEAGDVLLFDDLFVHQTGSDPSMPNPRYAIESWFFGASGFPADYAPLAA